MNTIDDTHVTTGAEQIEVATMNSAACLLGAPELTADMAGFGDVVMPDAPNTLPVLTEACADSGLTFWHDVNHVRRRLEFDLVDELEPSLSHLAQSEAAGRACRLMVWWLPHADLSGQTYVQAFAKRFPVDPRRFVNVCVAAIFDHDLHCLEGR